MVLAFPPATLLGSSSLLSLLSTPGPRGTPKVTLGAGTLYIPTALLWLSRNFPEEDPFYRHFKERNIEKIIFSPVWPSSLYQGPFPLARHTLHAFSLDPLRNQFKDGVVDRSSVNS